MRRSRSRKTAVHKIQLFIFGVTAEGVSPFNVSRCVPALARATLRFLVFRHVVFRIAMIVWRYRGVPPGMSNPKAAGDRNRGFFLLRCSMFRIFVAGLFSAIVVLAEATAVISLPYSTGHGIEADLAVTVDDPNGIANISEIRVLVKHDIRAEDGCYLVHYRGTTNVQLRNDADTSWSAPVGFGTSAIVANSQCSVFGSASAMTVTTDKYTLKLHIHFTGEFVGLRRIWAQTVDQINSDESVGSARRMVVPKHRHFPAA